MIPAAFSTPSSLPFDPSPSSTFQNAHHCTKKLQISHSRRRRRRPRTIVNQMDDGNDWDRNRQDGDDGEGKDHNGWIGGIWKGEMRDRVGSEEDRKNESEVGLKKRKKNEEKWKAWGGAFGSGFGGWGSEKNKEGGNKEGGSRFAERLIEVIAPKLAKKKEDVNEDADDSSRSGESIRDKGYLDRLLEESMQHRKRVQEESRRHNDEGLKGNIVAGLLQKLSAMPSSIFQKDEKNDVKGSSATNIEGGRASKDSLKSELEENKSVRSSASTEEGNRDALSENSDTLKKRQRQASASVEEERSAVTESTAENETAGDTESEKKSPTDEKMLEGSKDAVASRRGLNARPDIVPIPQKDIAQIRLIFGSETFFATETLSPPGGLIFRGNLRGEPTKTLQKLEQRLHARLGSKYTLCLAEGDEDLRPVVVVVPTSRDTRPWSPRQKLMSFMIGTLTLLTCIGRGAYIAMFADRLKGGPPRVNGVFAYFYRYPAVTVGLTIASVILFSQLVQRLIASRHRTRIGLPFFVPSYQLGSFGSVVQVASPPPTRAALFDIALSGAATLFLTSLSLLAVGLYLSTSLAAVIPMPTTMLSDSLFLTAVTRLITRGKTVFNADGVYVGLHPLAIVGANCMTIAALTLLPIRQFDGGRIISAIYGRKIALLASRVTVFFLLLASSKNPYFIVFLALVLFGPWALDRPAKNELTEPDATRVIVGYVFLLAMVAILLPWPASVPVLRFLGFRR